MAGHPRVIVVGAGIIGASIAYHLARAGVRVTVLEAAEPGGIATRNSWAWINASWGNPEVYFRLRTRSMAEWRRLEREIPSLGLAWVGGLLWDIPPDELEAYAREHASWGYGIRRVDRAEAARLEPQLRNPPDFALHVAEEGSVEPLAAVQALLAAAQDLGANILANRPARRLAQRNHRVVGVETEAGTLEADEIVVAAGAGTAKLTASAGYRLPLDTPPGLLIASRPHPKLLNGLVMSPGLHVRQTAEGRLLAGADFGGSDPGESAETTSLNLFEAMRGMFKDGAALEYSHHTVGYRPMPSDGFPVIGRPPKIDGLYLAAMHSGITLAPAVGLFAAEEIVKGTRNALLKPYGPERFVA
ncbi:MAG TPA: FAD-binding oxidoreductase [Dongiaceae bacterium]|nr:FAD-binding oxidoreductase [Dongiaceae bacterium]